ncbi:MAG: hypothetical protein ACLVJ6_03290 [Merdibacter sp.]
MRNWLFWNDEVIDGKSAAVTGCAQNMRQWVIDIVQHAERLLEGLTRWTGRNLEEMQRNWIGKSIGALVDFRLRACGAIHGFTIPLRHAVRRPRF